MSAVPHKETRFYAPVLNIGNFYLAYMMEHLYAPKFWLWQKVAKILSIVFLVVFLCKNTAFYYSLQIPLHSWNEEYQVFNNLTPHMNGSHAESVYFLDKYGQPAGLALH